MGHHFYFVEEGFVIDRLDTWLWHEDGWIPVALALTIAGVLAGVVLL